jgi:two-component system OmpR family sensor kinase
MLPVLQRARVRSERSRVQSRSVSDIVADNWPVSIYTGSIYIGDVRFDDEWVSALLGTLGVLVLGVIAVEVGLAVGTASTRSAQWTPSVIMSVLAAAGLLYGGHYLNTRPIPVGRHRRVLCWSLGGVGAFLAINAVTMIVLPPADVLALLSWVRWAGSIGAGAGLTLGLVEARAVQRAVCRERQSVRAEEAKTREDLLNYLNATLRHEVLNSASAILAHSDLIRDEQEIDPGVREKLAVIERQAQSMTTVIEDVRLLLQASRSTNGSEPVDLTEILRAETAEVSQRYDHATVEASMPKKAVVSADPMVRRGFANLLENAVEHNNGDGAHVHVSVERAAETVSVEIADDGPGIPESEREHLFERVIRDDANHGLGLALTDTLVKNYDGTVELAETGPDGATFCIELPRASGRT